VGFRCAMTLVGNPEINTNGMPKFRSAKAKTGRRATSKATP